MVTRREKVILQIEDRASAKALKAAGAFRTLDAAIDSLDGRDLNLDLDRQFRTSKRGLDAFTKSVNQSNKTLDSYTGRISLLVTTVAAIGPAFIPIGAAAVPIIAGLASGLGALAGGAAATMLAFSGFGDALGALNAFQLEPTAENVAKLQQEFDRLGPAGEQFVRYIDSLGPELEQLQRVAGDGIFPGFQTGIDELLTSLPEVRNFVADVSDTIGRLGADAGRSLANDDDWRAFFEYIRTDGAMILDQFGRSLGNFSAGLASMMTAFSPLSRDFSAGMVEMSRSFREWSAGLSQSDSFQEFIDYIREQGPQVREFLSALGTAVVDLATALAPWGSAVLPILTAVAQAFSAIASSPIGPSLATAAVAMAAFSKATSLMSGPIGSAKTGLSSFGGVARTTVADVRAMSGSMSTFAAASTSLRTNPAAAKGLQQIGQAARGAGPAILAMGALSSGAADKFGLVNTATLALAGSMAGPWGAAVGAGVGLLIDFTSGQNQAAEASADLANTLNQQTGAITDQSRAWAVSQFNDADLQAFDALGVSMTDVTDATLKGKDAVSELWDTIGGPMGERAGDLWQKVTEGWKLDEADRDFLKHYDQFKGAFDRASEAAGSADATMRRYQATHDAIADGASEAAVSVNELTAAMEEQNAEALGNLNALTAYGEALANLRQGFAKGGGFSELTESGRQNRQVFADLIAKYNELQGAAGQSVPRFRATRDAIADVGRKAGLSGKQIRNLQGDLDKPKILRITDNALTVSSRVNTLNRFLKGIPPEVITHMQAKGIPKTEQDVQRLKRKYDLTPPEVRTLMTLRDLASKDINGVNGLLNKIDGKKADPTVGVNDKASGVIAGIGAAIRSIDGLSATTYVNTVYRSSGVPSTTANSGASRNYVGRADGGTVPGPRYPYADKMLIVAAPGEEVITNRNGEADQFRADRAAGRIPAYADGGMVKAGRNADLRRRIDYGNDPRTSTLLRMAERGRFGWLDRAEVSFKRLNEAVDKSKKSLERERNERDKVSDKMKDLRSTVAGNLRSSLFETDDSGSAFSRGSLAGSYADVLGTLRGDITDANQYKAATRNLKRKGLDGGALRTLLAEGDPVAFARLSRAQVQQYERLYNRRQSATAQAASAAGNAVYGKQLASMEKEVRQGVRELRTLQKVTREEHREDRRARRRGARTAARARR